VDVSLRAGTQGLVDVLSTVQEASGPIEGRGPCARPFTATPRRANIGVDIPTGMQSVQREVSVMAPVEQLTIDRFHVGPEHSDGPGECAARDALRAQVSKLERDLSALVSQAFPHISPHDSDGEAFSGPRLLTLAELERLRDRLAIRVGDVQAQIAERSERERRAQALLKRMQLEPGRYKFVRLPVADLGQGGCGVWEVRPRLGLIGMLAGWWQVKLSSGCP
jgi:hypothetical protein